MNINLSGNSRITIDGVDYVGRDVSIKNGEVFVDGKKQNAPLGSTVNIEVFGDVKHLETHAGDVKCNNAMEVNTGSGDVNVEGDVHGSVRTGSGDVTCYNVSGSIRTGSGDVKHTTAAGG